MKTVGLVLLLAGSAWAESGNARAMALAKGNATAQRAVANIKTEVAGVKNAEVRAAVLELLETPRPTFIERFATAEAKEAVRVELVKQGLLEPTASVEQLFPPLPAKGAALSFVAAPASPVGRHHGYPGGLAEHTVFNLKSALALEANYRKEVGVEALDHDLIVAAPVLHDLFKAWVLQWNDDGTTLVQPKLGGTASHHVFAVAEVLYRKLPAKLAVAVANAHEPSGAPVVLYLRAAALLAGVDPVAVGVLVRDGEGFALPWPVLPEGAINHLSDHDYVLADPGETAMHAVLEKYVRDEAVAKSDIEVRWRCHALETKVPGLKLYTAWVSGGDAALAAALKKVRL